jgi:hypothetical protein
VVGDQRSKFSQVEVAPLGAQTRQPLGAPVQQPIQTAQPVTQPVTQPQGTPIDPTTGQPYPKRPRPFPNMCNQALLYVSSLLLSCCIRRLTAFRLIKPHQLYSTIGAVEHQLCLPQLLQYLIREKKGIRAVLSPTKFADDETKVKQ